MLNLMQGLCQTGDIASRQRTLSRSVLAAGVGSGSQFARSKFGPTRASIASAAFGPAAANMSAMQSKATQVEQRAPGEVWSETAASASSRRWHSVCIWVRKSAAAPKVHLYPRVRVAHRSGEIWSPASAFTL